ncbi:transcriptional regulator domain-containing protein [Desulfonatronum parangueonense]
MGIRRNWRDPDEYVFTKNLNFLGWGWEFLRRNPEYQRDYELQSGTEEDREKFYEVNAKYDDKAIFEICEIKWLIQEFINPEDDNPHIDVSLEGIPSPEMYGLQYFLSEIDEGHYSQDMVLYKFNLNYNISGQIKKAKEYLEQIKNAREQFQRMKDPKNQTFDNKRFLEKKKSTWITYLRTLDAENEFQMKNDGSTQKKDISEAIFPHIDNTYDKAYPANDLYKKNLLAARSMVDDGFKHLFVNAVISVNE